MYLAVAFIRTTLPAPATEGGALSFDPFAVAFASRVT